jgi:hypothetical protein
MSGRVYATDALHKCYCIGCCKEILGRAFTRDADIESVVIDLA